jgi:hypothetical protein
VENNERKVKRVLAKFSEKFFDDMILNSQDEKAFVRLTAVLC